jgi:hypothetical protein
MQRFQISTDKASSREPGARDGSMAEKREKKLNWKESLRAVDFQSSKKNSKGHSFELYKRTPKTDT